MRNLVAFLVLLGLLMVAVAVGDRDSVRKPVEKTDTEGRVVPHLGRVEVLNGCGAGGAAGIMAEFLRAGGFDVKSIGNAETWNYPFTIVAARTGDMTIARQIAQALGTDKCIMLRTSDSSSYDVTVFVGEDFQERIE